jgi:hypothetical protein
MTPYQKAHLETTLIVVAGMVSTGVMLAGLYQVYSWAVAVAAAVLP